MPIVLIFLCLGAVLSWKKYRSFLRRSRRNYREGRKRTKSRLKAQVQEFLFNSQMMDLSHFESLDGITALLEGTQDKSPVTIGRQESVSITPI